MRVDEKHLLQTCEELWESMLGLRLERNGACSERHNEKLLSSCISVEGDWQGAIVLQCPESIARHAAVMLLAADAERAEANELQEALNELARAVCQKAKEMLPDPSRLSEPFSEEQSSKIAALSGMTPLSEYDLTCEGRLVRLSLLQA
jgi:hypothetical protein